MRALPLALALSLGAGCATTIPHELLDARAAYVHAQNSPGASLVPDELHKAKASLDKAELAYANDPEEQSTRDFAYVAQRKAQLAEARGGIAIAEREKDHAIRGELVAQAEVTEKVKTDLARTEGRLSDEKRKENEKEMALQRSRDQLAAERQVAERDRDELEKTQVKLDETESARREAEQRAAKAMQDLAVFAAIKEEERGTVITISGSVLFATAQWAMLPDAQSRLDQVANALATRKESIVVEGHTDSRGGDSYNQDLSQRRAEAVRQYLIGRGIPSDRIRAMGYGKVRPIADNHTAEGRANNRRVEIVLERIQGSR